MTYQIHLDNVGARSCLTASCARTLGEAAAVCLESVGHTSPAILRAGGGDTAYEIDLQWTACTEQARRSYRDPYEAAELGACAVAIEMIRCLTGLIVVERSRRGTGFDYWLGKEGDGLFSGTARLEVSGILRGTEHDVRVRLRRKLAQLDQSNETGLIGYAVVVEFSQPQAKLRAKELL